MTIDERLDAVAAWVRHRHVPNWAYEIWDHIAAIRAEVAEKDRRIAELEGGTKLWLQSVALGEETLKRRIAELEGEVSELRESISPGRIGKHAYYLGVAKRFRQDQVDAGRVIRARWMPTHPTPPRRRKRRIWGGRRIACPRSASSSGTNSRCNAEIAPWRSSRARAASQKIRGCQMLATPKTKRCVGGALASRCTTTWTNLRNCAGRWLRRRRQPRRLDSL